MPIRREMRFLYPIDWPQISRFVLFGRPGRFGPGRCDLCGRPHEKRVFQMADGRWFDIADACWRTDRGKPCRPPALEEIVTGRFALSRLAACHRDHDPAHNSRRNLARWCGRHHLAHDQPEHLRRRRITIRRRRACGDLFEGAYPAP